jgi:hypothetical protein
MFRKAYVFGILVFVASSTMAHQTMYFNKDHIYAGAGGKEIAVVTPAPSDQILPTAPSGLTTSNLTSTSIALWFNTIECDVIACGLFSTPDLNRKLMRYIREGNKNPKPIKWSYSNVQRKIRPNTILSVAGH